MLYKYFGFNQKILALHKAVQCVSFFFITYTIHYKAKLYKQPIDSLEFHVTRKNSIMRTSRKRKNRF